MNEFWCFKCLRKGSADQATPGGEVSEAVEAAETKGVESQAEVTDKTV